MNENPQTLDLRRHWRAMRRGWPLYLIAFVVMMGLATYYALNKQSQYQIKGLVLIEEEKESAAGLRAMGGMAQMMRTFSMGGFSSSVDNEMAVIASHDVHMRAVKALSLNRTYVLRTGLLTRQLLYRNSPVRLDAPEALFDSIPRSLKVNVHLHDGKADISVRRGRFYSPTWTTKDATLPCNVVTPYGNMQLLKTSNYNPSKDLKIDINISNNNDIATFLQKKISIAIPSKKGDAIKLTLKDDRQRGIDIINAVIAAYNEKRNERRKERAQIEVDFVNNRLAILQQELADVEGRVTRFKQSNNVNNPIIEAQGWLKQSAEAQAEAAAAQGELTVYEMILNTLRGTDDNAMLPDFEGMKDPSVTQYNELVAKRTTLAQSAAPGNAALDALDKQIKPLRESIIKRAEKKKDAARIKLNAIYSHAGRTQGRYNQMPQAEQQYYDLLRDRELKNDLYVFLLEKKENGLLKMNTNSSPAFILDDAYTGTKTDKTKAIIVFALSLLLALLVPTLFLLWRMRRQNRLEEPCDLPSDFESRTITANDDNDWLNISSSIISNPNLKCLLVSDINSNIAAKALQSITTASQNAKIRTIDSIAELQSIKQSIPEGEIAVIKVEDWQNTAACYRLAPNSKAVLILLAGNTLRRSEFDHYFASIPAKDCIVAFTD